MTTETPAEAGRGAIDTCGGRGSHGRAEGAPAAALSGTGRNELGSGCLPWTVLAVLIALVSGLFPILGHGGGPGNGHPDGG
ncbi:hypothetical protein ACIHCV_26585 [Streptomyces sp. NPDC051956]|uniref:hypothetical protein n=1 Tax=Streptomyces sp. NPDC051956 TaxID=3365677 RepID=UPI0037D8B2FA